MWKALIKLVEKWACCHEWELHQRMSTYDDYSGNKPWKVEETLICAKLNQAKGKKKIKRSDMNSSIEFGKCDICGKEDNLGRTYFEYDIKCDCHSPRHFELVVHCEDCIPSIPTEIHPYIKAMDGKSYKTTITNILPIEIVGEFIITEPIIQE